MQTGLGGSPLLWLAFGVLVIVSLIIDLGIHSKRDDMSTKESALWAAGWVVLALLFGAALFPLLGATQATNYFTAYLLEKALSVDNLFVFIVIFSFFRIPMQQQRRVLFWGILGAVFMRALFIWLGISLLSRFGWVFYVFGAFLIFTAVKMFLHKSEEVHPDKSLAYRALKRILPISNTNDGHHFFLREQGKLLATPLFVVLVVIEATDVVFAVDSIPAVLAITHDPFVVYTSNIFAILGLRALYFLLAGVMTRFRYLDTGLALILAFIGVKMLVHDYLHIPPLLSLLVVMLVLTAAIVASIVVERRQRPLVSRGEAKEGARE